MCSVTKSCPKICDRMDHSLPGSSVYGILQARILEWVVTSCSRGSSQPRDGTHVSCIGRQILCHWATREVSPALTRCKNIIKPGDARGFSVLINFDLWYFSVKEKLPAGGPDSTWRGLGWFANNRSRPGLGWCMLCALGRAQREAGGIQEQPSAVFVLSLLASWMAKSGQSGHKVWSCGWKPLGSEGWQQTLPSSKSAASWKTCLFVKWCLKQVWAWVV